MATDKEIDEVYDRIDGLLLEGKFGEGDQALRSVDVQATDTTLLLSYLTASAPARTKLQWRQSFADRCFSEILKRDGIHETKRLLDGLV